LAAASVAKLAQHSRECRPVTQITTNLFMADTPLR
jgi:hypothetical protein